MKSLTGIALFAYALLSMAWDRLNPLTKSTPAHRPTEY